MTNDRTVSLIKCVWFCVQATLILSVVLSAPLAAQMNSLSGAVSRITDGDTFRMQGLDRAIRVWGLDAPERDQAGAMAATRALQMLISGQMIACHIRDMDRYGRIVGQCFLPDGRDIAMEMIRLGVATEYCRYSGGYYRTC